MERHEILEMMGELKLAGMRAAFDEVLANGVKRQHAAQQIVGDLLAAEIAEKQARSIRYQVAAAKLPLAKELADFDFAGGLINEGLVRELAVARSSSSSATPCWWAAREPARPTSRSPSRATASASGRDAGSTRWSTWSTGSKRRARPGGRGRSPTR